MLGTKPDFSSTCAMRACRSSGRSARFGTVKRLTSLMAVNRMSGARESTAGGHDRALDRPLLDAVEANVEAEPRLRRNVDGAIRVDLVRRVDQVVLEQHRCGRHVGGIG